MMPARLGEPKAPMAAHGKSSRSEDPVGEVDGQDLEQHEATRAAEHAARGEGRAPKRSERMPDSGPAIRKPAVSGSMTMPAHNGVRAKRSRAGGAKSPAAR